MIGPETSAQQHTGHFSLGHPTYSVLDAGTGPPVLTAKLADEMVEHLIFHCLAHDQDRRDKITRHNPHSARGSATGVMDQSMTKSFLGKTVCC